jgi:inner membrane protein
MASAFSHAFAAVALGKVCAARRMHLRFWVLSALCAVLPDADVLGFAFGVSYGDVLGHRGLTHSLTFALLVGLVVVWVWFRGENAGWNKKLLVLYFFAVTASHGVLDAMTDGGLGVAFFAPFENSRYFLPFRPIAVSPIGVGAFFSRWGLEVIRSELVWIWLPSAALAALAVALRKRQK